MTKYLISALLLIFSLTGFSQNLNLVLDAPVGKDCIVEYSGVSFNMFKSLNPNYDKFISDYLPGEEFTLILPKANMDKLNKASDDIYTLCISYVKSKSVYNNGNYNTTIVKPNSSSSNKRTSTNSSYQVSSYSSYCGARTKSGGSCRRKVSGGGRCWQH